MNKLFLSSLNLFIPLLIFAQGAEHLGNAKSTSRDSAQSIAVIELFSSEGCSSCPAADEMINKIALDATNKHLSIYVLEEHVDYLNSAGWRDTFGNKQFSERQKTYNHFLHDDNTYTPQIFVNGIHEVYVPTSTIITEEINRALKEPALSAISFSVSPINDTTAEVDYHLSATDKNWMINFALVQKNAVSAVTTGENKGLTLTHVNVVKQLIVDNVTIPDGLIQFNFHNYSANTFSVIAFIQDKLTMKIIGAVQMDI